MGTRSLQPQHEHTGDPKLDRIQEAIKRIATFLVPIAFLDGKLLDGSGGGGSGPGITIGTSDTAVFHGLGRAPRGFIVLDRAVNPVTPVRSTNQPKDQTKFFNLIATASVTVKLWVW